MSSVSVLMDGLGDALSTITGLRVTDYVSGQVNPPAAAVGLPSVSFDSTMARGSDQYTFQIRVFVASAYNKTATLNLSKFMSGTGTSSIKAKLEADPTLGGVCDTLRVTNAESGWVEHAGSSYLVADFDVDVIARSV